MTHRGLAIEIIDRVREYSSSVRHLRGCWRQLARDLLAVLAGLRPAILLDYTTATADQLQVLVSRLRAASAAAGFQNGKLLCQDNRPCSVCVIALFEYSLLHRVQPQPGDPGRLLLYCGLPSMAAAPGKQRPVAKVYRI